MPMRRPDDPLYKVDPFYSFDSSLTNTGLGQFIEKDIVNPLGNILGGENNDVGNVGQALQNVFYDLTGQTEKTSFYKSQVERENELIERQEAREDTAMQRGAADMEASGLSKYGLTGGAAGSSAGGSSNVHSGSNTRLSALVDIAKSVAEIDNVQANTNKTNAEAAATTAGVERDDKYYALSELKNAAEIDRIEVENELTKNMSAESAQRTVASIQEQARAEAMHVYEVNEAFLKNSLLMKDNSSYGERLETDLAVKRTSAFLNQQKAESEIKQREYISKQIEEAAARIAHYIAQDLHLSYQDQLLAEDYAYRQLQYEVLNYDYNYSQEHLLRTTDPVSRIAGVNFDQFVSGLGSLGDWTSGFSFNHRPTGSGGGSAW